MSLSDRFLHTLSENMQANFDRIFDTLQTPKLSTQDNAVLADIHREMHALLAGADQVSTEYQKPQYFMQALKDDPAGKHATKKFLRREYFSIPDHRFADLVEIVILHDPTYIATNSTFGYSNAMSVASVSAALAAPTDELGLAQFIAKHQKDLATIKKKNGKKCSPSSQRWLYRTSEVLLQTRLSTEPHWCCLSVSERQQPAALKRSAPRSYGPPHSSRWQSYATSRG